MQWKERRKALYANCHSFPGVMWKHARQCKESQACCWLWGGPDARLSSGATVNQKWRKGGMGGETDIWQKKELKKGVYAVREKQKHLEGGRCPEAVLETEGCGGGETGRKMKEPPAVSPSPTLRSAPLSTDWGWDPNRRVLPFHTFPNISPNFPIQIHNFTCIFFPYIAPILPLCLCHLLPLCLSHSLEPIFTSKHLHYLPSLRAIRNGVTLSCRHGRCFIATHPLSWEPFVEAADIDGEDTGASSVHPPLHIPPHPPPASPSFWLVNCGVNGV